MGPVEEGGKVASGIVEALKAQPVVLALVVFNMAFIAAVYISTNDARAKNNELMKIMIEQQAKTSEFLSRCVVPPRVDLLLPRAAVEHVPLPKPRPVEEPPKPTAPVSEPDKPARE
jgi:hypothetical protein